MEKTLDQKIKQATEKWVGEFNAIPLSFIENALGDKVNDEFVQVFPNLKVCVNCSNEFTELEYKKLEEEYMNSATGITCPHCKDNAYGITGYREHSYAYHTHLPMWKTVWTFDTDLDNEWVLDNIETVYKCGFRVYKNEHLGVVIGIDECSDDFYESHWIPLYKARGLRRIDVYETK